MLFLHRVVGEEGQERWHARAVMLRESRSNWPCRAWMLAVVEVHGWELERCDGHRLEPSGA